MDSWGCECMGVVVLGSGVSPGEVAESLNSPSPILLWKAQNLVITVLYIATFTHSILLFHDHVGTERGQAVCDGILAE